MQAVFLASAISVTLISAHVSAQSSPQTLMAGVILQASEIDSSKVQVGAYKENKPMRIVGKLAGGILAGTLVGLAVGSVSEKAAGDCTGTFCGLGQFITGGWFGYLVGVPSGVSLFDPHGRFIYSLAGSLIGGTAIMSEFSRKPLEVRRVSIGLLPGPKGRLSAIATLRF
ncbi:MAG: hypothetical protein F4Z86_17605 [Gemmatimonadetes bacterium]|nr:hypothetical protein [Gemmatimonadota bacterium]MYB55303.1 hypothetical protein [Gemmatimonadota bacterium]